VTLIERLGEAFFRGAPRTPGIYLMFGVRDELLYVGKAKNLRARLMTYARAAPGRSPDKLVRLTSAVRAIRWEQFRTETEAIARETDLLRGVRPPFNAAQTDRGDFLFITVTDTRPGRVHLNLSASSEGSRVYGCFPYGARALNAFPALVRLLCLAQGRPVPSRPTRATGCEIPLEEALARPLHEYLSGRSAALVSIIDGRLESVEGFKLRPARTDLATVLMFYRDGTRGLRRLRLRHKLPAGPISRRRLGELLAEDVRALTGSRVELRDGVEERVRSMAAAGRDMRSIAGALNADRIPAFGSGKPRGWTIWHVEKILRRDGWAQPNQRRVRAEANSSFSRASSSDGPRKGAVGAGPLRKSASTLPTKPPPNSM
jgi:predicted GIY-YIG superfamily endonuclease